MCRECGCTQSATPAATTPNARADRLVVVGKKILADNDEQAARNRSAFRAQGVRVLNVVSAPGSGKTELLCRTITDLAGQVRVGVIVGDLATDNDAQRLRATGCPVVQITTGNVCHLEAGMIAQAAEQLDLGALDLLVIENVGNLVCPAGFDLGEERRVVLLSVTEGEDKPLKYPVLFRTAQAVVVTKTDLAEAVGFDRALALDNIRRAAPDAVVFEVSARRGQGLAPWCAYLERLCYEAST